MGREEFQSLKGGILKRKNRRIPGVFIDATGLDRATRRISKKIDLSKLLQTISGGTAVEVAKYYCLIPYEDDARQLSYLDAVNRAGFEVVTKRLPPKGVNRQVSLDVQIATDMINFCYGYYAKKSPNNPTSEDTVETSEASTDVKDKRVLTVVCPSMELNYSFLWAKHLGAETVVADFGIHNTNESQNGITNWIDLSNSELIWKD
ncbi:MAG: NYN domain-containing protein, partial [Proteobacteria bacterium]|nr:NYN domain-containing protein [Pseudomonadota bacterium]